MSSRMSSIPFNFADRSILYNVLSTLTQTQAAKHARSTGALITDRVGHGVTMSNARNARDDSRKTRRQDQNDETTGDKTGLTITRTHLTALCAYSQDLKELYPLTDAGG